MARPRKENRRSVPIPTRYSEEERDTLTLAAHNAGVTLSDFIRAASLSQPLPSARSQRANRRPVKDAAELAKMLGAVGKIGSNVNQLAHRANLGSWPEARLLHEAAADIQWMRRSLMLALGVREEPEQPAP